MSSDIFDDLAAFLHTPQVTLDGRTFDVTTRPSDPERGTQATITFSHATPTTRGRQAGKTATSYVANWNETGEKPSEAIERIAESPAFKAWVKTGLTY